MHPVPSVFHRPSPIRAVAKGADRNCYRMIRLLLYQVCRNDRLSADFAFLVRREIVIGDLKHIDDRFCEVLPGRIQPKCHVVRIISLKKTAVVAFGGIALCRYQSSWARVSCSAYRAAFKARKQSVRHMLAVGIELSGGKLIAMKSG